MAEGTEERASEQAPGPRRGRNSPPMLLRGFKNTRPALYSPVRPRVPAVLSREPWEEFARGFGNVYPPSASLVSPVVLLADPLQSVGSPPSSLPRSPLRPFLVLPARRSFSYRTCPHFCNLRLRVKDREDLRSGKRRANPPCESSKRVSILSQHARGYPGVYTWK